MSERRPYVFWDRSRDRRATDGGIDPGFGMLVLRRVRQRARLYEVSDLEGERAEARARRRSTWSIDIQHSHTPPPPDVVGFSGDDDLASRTSATLRDPKLQ